MMKPEEEEEYFEEANRLNFLLHTLEMRLVRLRDLSPLRFDALKNYLSEDGRLGASSKMHDKEDDFFYSMF